MSTCKLSLLIITPTQKDKPDKPTCPLYYISGLKQQYQLIYTRLVLFSETKVIKKMVGSLHSKKSKDAFKAFLALLLTPERSHHGKCCFFLFGCQDNPVLKHFFQIEGSFTKELQDLEVLYKETTGQEMSRFYRPPQGIYSEENLQMARDLGYKTVFWSLAYVDWLGDAQPSKAEAFAKLLPRTHPGAVVLLHSTSQTNAAILRELIETWKAEGYVFETLDSLFAAH